MSMANPPQNYDDPHRLNPDVHYRLYDSKAVGPTVICVQDFDYLDYDARKFLSPEAWDNEEEAEEALRTHLERRNYSFITRAVVAEELSPGDVVNVVFDPSRGLATVIAYRHGEY